MWALGSHRESPSAYLTHLPAILSSINSFQDLENYISAVKCYLRDVGTAQETQRGCAEGASRVCWHTPAIQALPISPRSSLSLSQYDLYLDVGFSPPHLGCWQEASVLAYPHIPVKKRPGHSGHRFPVSGVLCHTF